MLAYWTELPNGQATAILSIFQSCLTDLTDVPSSASCLSLKWLLTITEYKRVWSFILLFFWEIHAGAVHRSTLWFKFASVMQARNIQFILQSQYLPSKCVQHYPRYRWGHCWSRKNQTTIVSQRRPTLSIILYETNLLRSLYALNTNLMYLVGKQN